MNITAYTSEVSSRLGGLAPLALPRTLWAYYLEYLWFYTPDSWVGTAIAQTLKSPARSLNGETANRCPARRRASASNFFISAWV